jgi:Icc-related predicted phosphoesterase
MDKSIKESTTKNIVVTHMAPSIKSIHPKYVNSPDNPVFNSHMDDWVKKRNIELWIHGHTHQSCDYMIDNTRVVCNPRGHPKDGVNENKRFFANLVVEV